MKIVDASGIRAAEEAATAGGTPEFVLMKRAGAAAANLISAWMRRYAFSRIVFLCGGGNNAGDALVAATMLHGKYPVSLWLYRPLDAFRGAAASAAAELPEELKRCAIADGSAPELVPGDLVVDGLLGIGLSGEVRPELAAVIARVNASQLPVIALDVPSGMDSDTGVGHCPGGEALHAACTITFGLPKRGLFTFEGIRFSGRLVAARIGLENSANASGCEEAYTEYEAFADLPRFAADTHKNRRGQLLVMAGSRRYPGAAALTTLAALRGGAGLVRSFIPSGAPIRLAAAAIPNELAATGEGGFAAAPDWGEFPGAAALTAGPGWGGDVPLSVLNKVLEFPGSLLLDADALNLLARHPDAWRRREGVVLTPHPGEAERLRRAFDIPEAETRGEAASALAARLGATVVLKGARSVVADGTGKLFFNISGSPDLATAGSGDVLAGLIGAFLANGMAPAAAAGLGVFIHGRAGERRGCGCIADDLPAEISAVMDDLKNGVFF